MALLGHGTDERFARWRERLRRGAREATLWIFALVGVALMGDAASRFSAASKDATTPSVLTQATEGTQAIKRLSCLRPLFLDCTAD